MPPKRLVVGASGSGKTQLSHRLLAPETRLVVLDWTADSPRLGGWSTSCNVATTWDEVLWAVQQPRFRVAVQIEESPVTLLSTMAEVLQATHDDGRALVSDIDNPVMFAVEEVSGCFEVKGRNPPEGSPVNDLLRFGRKDGIGLHLITQRPVDCPPLVRDQLTDFYSFRFSSAGVHRELVGGLHLPTSGVDVPSIIRELPQYSYCHVDFRRGSLISVIGADGRPMRFDAVEGTSDGQGNAAQGGRDPGDRVGDPLLPRGPEDRGGLNDEPDSVEGRADDRRGVRGREPDRLPAGPGVPARREVRKP